MSDGVMVTETGVGVVTPEQMTGFRRTPMMLGVRTRQIREQTAAALDRRRADAEIKLQMRAALDRKHDAQERARVRLAPVTMPERYTDPPPLRACDPIESLTLAPHGPTAAGVLVMPAAA